jgi:fibronectin type 3 domain-containing protein
MSGVNFPVTLNPNQTASLNLQFDPPSTGSMTGTVTLSSNASNGGTSSISLSGTGTASSYQVDLAWYAPTGSSDPVAGYNVYRATGSGSYARLNSSPSTSASWTDTTVQNGQTYNYEITSVDASGVESVPSSSSSVSIP